MSRQALSTRVRGFSRTSLEASFDYAQDASRPEAIYTGHFPSVSRSFRQASRQSSTWLAKHRYAQHTAQTACCYPSLPLQPLHSSCVENNESSYKSHSNPYFSVQEGERCHRNLSVKVYRGF